MGNECCRKTNGISLSHQPPKEVPGGQASSPIGPPITEDKTAASDNNNGRAPATVATGSSSSTTASDSSSSTTASDSSFAGRKIDAASSISARTVNAEGITDDVDACCPICFEVMCDNGLPAMTTVCGHVFCQRCLQCILARRPYCPICRRYQPRYKDESDEDESLDESIEWNREVVRAFLTRTPDEHGMRHVYLSDGTETNVRIQENAKLTVDPGARLIINGKRIENPTACNQQ